MTTKRTIEVSLFGETREVECFVNADRLIGVGLDLVGRFPTGAKVHRASVVLDRRNARPEHPLRGETAAVVDGEEYVASLVLYTHNRNVGRIFGWWNPEKIDAEGRREMVGGVPRFKRVAAGDYETADGEYRLVQLDGGATRAWNVELATEAVERWIEEDPERRYVHPESLIVDGARTKRDALALFADWWISREA